MNACVESVCPSPMMPEALAPPVAIEPLGNPAREATRTGFARAWARLARVREKNAPAIVHVHAESFYAAVEQAENPRLKGRGVLVVGEGVVASASPEAASRGVLAGMTIRDARKICPNAIVIPGEYVQYAECAERVRRILETYCPCVEMTACGSFYLDSLDAPVPFSAFEAKLRQMQADILGQTGLSVAVGAGTSRLVAALAAREHRPCGLRIVARGEERAFLAPLPLEKLRAIGTGTISALRRGGIATLGELRQIPKPVLAATFGALVGYRLWNLARGHEVTEVGCGVLAAELARSEVPV